MICLYRISISFCFFLFISLYFTTTIYFLPSLHLQQPAERKGQPRIARKRGQIESVDDGGGLTICWAPIMKEIDTETTVVWPAWCYSGKSCPRPSQIPAPSHIFIPNSKMECFVVLWQQLWGWEKSCWKFSYRFTLLFLGRSLVPWDKY